MGDKIKAFWLGLFIVVAIALLIWLVMFLKPSVGDGAVQLRVLFTNIDKVTTGSRVTYAGRPVGEVIAIREIKIGSKPLLMPKGISMFMNWFWR